jgi:hypothetical protein
MDISSEHKILDLKNRIEASIVIWKRKMNQKDSKSAWGSAVSLEKRELFEERAETILLLLKQRFPGIPQSSLDVSKIQYNKERIDPLSSEFYFILHLELNEKALAGCIYTSFAILVIFVKPGANDIFLS